MNKAEHIWNQAMILKNLMILSGMLVIWVNIAWSGPDLPVNRKVIQITPVFQNWKMDSLPDLSEVSIMAYMYYPISPDLNLSMRFGRASVGGDVSSLSGFTDFQTIFSYYLSNYSSILHLAINLPTGKNELTPEQFGTSVEMSQNLFRLQYPNLGQGLNYSLGISRALQLKESLVIGFGLSYQVKRKYKPVSDFGEYDSGNELLLTAGGDYRLDETSRLTSDLTYFRFGSDKIDGKKIVSAGNRFLLALKYLKYFGFDELNVRVIYRIHPRNEYYIPSQPVSEREKYNPDQFEISGNYRLRMQRRLYLRTMLDLYFSQKSVSLFSGARLVGVGVAPELTINPAISGLAELKYFFGGIKNNKSVTGFNFGIGVAINF